ncbi:MAG: hypothetical protein JRD47_08820 [Deltaproteobacteria bacterium]|nr:hypothetical protein [Deltaproteobacteria bacterium]
MGQDSIRVHTAEGKTIKCSTVILVPEIALSEAGHIKLLSCNSSPQAKHEFHALAQMAFIQFQDEELEINMATESIKLEWNGENIEVSSGMVIYRDLSGGLEVFCHSGQLQRKLLEAAHRFCARWIRLDI